MVKTKKELIKHIETTSQNIIKMGLEFQNLARSLEERKNKLTLAEMKEIIKPYADRIKRRFEK